MWRVLALVAAVAGCDHLFDIAPVTIVDSGGGGGGGGGGGEGGALPDTMMPCTPTMRTAVGQTVTSGSIGEAAYTEQGSGFAIITSSVTGTLTAFQPLGTGGTSSPTNLAQAFASPGLSADGAGLYVATGTAVERFVDNNDPTTWTQGATVSSLATYKPSAIGVAPDGSYRMVVSSNQNGLFQEMRSTDGGMTWGSFDAALSSMDLTNDGTLVISSPNLSSDARNLVYLSIDTTLTPPEYTVRFVHRDDARIGFKLATIGGPLLAPRTQRLASPYLSRDCARLYVVIASTAIALFT